MLFSLPHIFKQSHFIKNNKNIIILLTRANVAPTTWTVTKEIVGRDGLGFKGLNKGVTATIGRNGTFNMIYFGFYHSVKDYFPAYEVRFIESIY